MNPEQEIELVLRVLSTQPTDEETFHLEHEDVNPRKVEQEPEEKPEEEPEEKPEEEPVPLPVPVGGTLCMANCYFAHDSFRISRPATILRCAISE
jgi:hypothetical protein